MRDPRLTSAPFDHLVRIRDTNFQLQATLDTSSASIHDVFMEMIADEARNDLIFDDVLHALEAGRSPVVITERTAHLETIAKRLERFARHVIVLRGGQSEKQRRDVSARLASIPKAEERVIVATGRYLGEGFDDSRLDTLFLTMPIAWKGTLAQYAGRLHRLNDAKREVIIYDYVDMRVPVLARMAAKRRIGYQAIGYEVLGTRDLFSRQAVTSKATLLSSRP
jgi:superfamily II DNA or RNA helicase